MSNLKRKIKNLLNSYRGFHEPDKKLIVVIFTILTFGLISLSSASSVIAYDKFGDPYYYFKHQLFGLALGLIAFAIFSRIDYHIWKEYAFGFLFYLAAWLEARKKDLGEIEKGIGPFIVVLGAIAFLMLKQPDMGTLSIIAITSLIVYFVGGGKIKHILLILLFGVLSFGVMVQFKPYQLNRFKCMIDPSFDAADACYQINQSLIAVGSGGVLGRGLGASRQKYMYLPEVSGDSIFAIIAEETGFVVSVIFIILFLYLFYCGYKIAKNAPDDFGRILAIGISSWIVMQALINIGGIINAMPMTGVPLPLVSYGGSAILAALTACGILVNISRQTKGEKTGRR